MVSDCETLDFPDFIKAYFQMVEHARECEKCRKELVDIFNNPDFYERIFSLKKWWLKATKQHIGLIY